MSAQTADDPAFSGTVATADFDALAPAAVASTADLGVTGPPGRRDRAREGMGWGETITRLLSMAAPYWAKTSLSFVSGVAHSSARSPSA